MVLPPFPPASYVEAPGYILPHTQLHMVDYRRMTAPHLAPTMAYQTRRFRYQHMTPSGRVMVSSEVQTEPVGTNSRQQGCDVTSTQSSSDSARSTDCGSVFSSPKSNGDKSTGQKKGCTILSNKMSGETTRVSTAQNGGILFHAEEVRIECSGSPSAVKIVHAKETTELASNADGEFLQCNMGSTEDLVLRCFQPVPFEGDDERKGIKGLDHMEDPCSDIVMVSCPANGSVSTLEGSIVAPVEPINSTLVVQGDPGLVKDSQDICENPKNIHFKILRLPLDLQCLDELRQMEASVWSVESLMPYVPGSEWMMQNSLMTPGKPSLATVFEVPAESSPESNQSPVEATPSLLEAGTVIELDGQESMTSLESLPPFLPSGSRLAGFAGSYYNNLSSDIQNKTEPYTWAKEQPKIHQETQVQSGQTSPNAESKKLKEEMSNQSVTISGDRRSDQEHCASPLFSDSPHKHKVRMCKICSVKRGSDACSGCLSSKAGCMKRYKVARSHLTGEKNRVPLCATCMRDPEKKARCKVAAVTANAESNNMKNEMNEVSENEVYPTKCQKKLYNTQSPPSGKHLEKCPMSRQSKLREQNCLCEETKASDSTSACRSNGRNQCNSLTKERNEENLALSTIGRWNDPEQRFTDGKVLNQSLYFLVRSVLF